MAKSKVLLVHRKFGQVEILGAARCGDGGFLFNVKERNGRQRRLLADPMFWPDPRGNVRDVLQAALVAALRDEGRDNPATLLVLLEDIGRLFGVQSGTAGSENGQAIGGRGR